MNILQKFVALLDCMNLECQTDGKDFVNFCGLLRKHNLYRDLPRPLWNHIRHSVRIVHCDFTRFFSNSSLIFFKVDHCSVIRMPCITSDSFPITIWRIFRLSRGSLPVGNGNCSDHVVVGSPNICALFAIPNYFDYPNWKSIYVLQTTFSRSSAQMYLSFSTVSYTNYYRLILMRSL